MKVQVVDSLMTGQLPTLANPPASFPQSIGLKFHALEDQSGGIPRLEANVDNLTSIGPFTNMNGLPAINQLPTDLPFGNGGPGATRLIEVFAQGDSEEYPVFPGSPSPIAEVALAVNGGAMDGGPDSSHQGGWDIGIYSAAGSTGTSTDNYTAGYSVTTTGAVFERFRQAGLHGTANVATRGIVKLRGQTRVSGTGSGLGHNTALYPIHNGVHLFCLEGYLALSADDSNFGENTGSGVFLSCAGSRAQDSPHPMGLFLGMRRCKIHLNGDTGLELFSGVLPIGAQYAAQTGIVGGSWTRSSGFADLTTGDPSASLPFGQGVVDRCSISNNGGNGIHVQAEGSAEHYIFCRFTNNIIWNQPLEGFRSDVTSDGSGGNGIILTPIIQSTLAGNGDLVGASVEFEDQGVGISAAYSWVPPAGGNPAFGTEIDNTILQRKNSLASDLGPNLDIVRGAPTVPGILGPGFIGLGGLRFTPTGAFGGKTTTGLLVSTDSTTPFLVGAPMWTALNASQFFLDALGANIADFKNITPTFVNVPSPEIGHDYSGDLRTDLLSAGDYDKGAEELP